MDFKLTTPVVFIVFNRPETTARVFEEIRKAKPETLLLIADGPRYYKPGEEDRCEQVKRIVENIDWDCTVLRNYSDKNLGCKIRISSGLEWAFENVEEAIILEDDCLPNQTFFRFCQELLQKYRNDERIMHISGTNVHSSELEDKYSYYFSGLAQIWGWATWKRSFKNFDVKLSDWPYNRNSDFLNPIIYDLWYRKYVRDVLTDIYNGCVDTWDYQWNYSIWKEEGLCINPNINLISNIGFGEDATHTKKKNTFSDRLVFDLEFPIKHPSTISKNIELDVKEISNNRQDWKYKFLPYPVFKTLKWIRNKMRRIKSLR